MSASQDLGNLLRVMEPHVGEDSVTIEGGKFANFYAVLLAIKRQVVALENAQVPPGPRACHEPPWGFGKNVVALFARRDGQS